MSTIGSLLFVIFGSIFFYDISVFISGPPLSPNWSEFLFFCIPTFASFLVAISFDIYFFSLSSFTLVAFVCINVEPQGALFSTLCFWLIGMTIIIFMSIHAHKAINHEERSYIQRILYGYEEICFSAQKAWIEFLGGTTGKHEKEQIDRLLQEKKDLEYKCKRLSEMYAKEHKNYERLEAEYRDFQLNVYDKKRK